MLSSLLLDCHCAGRPFRRIPLLISSTGLTASWPSILAPLRWTSATLRCRDSTGVSLARYFYCHSIFTCPTILEQDKCTLYKLRKVAWHDLKKMAFNFYFLLGYTIPQAIRIRPQDGGHTVDFVCHLHCYMCCMSLSRSLPSSHEVE